MAALRTSPVAGSGWLGMWQVTNRFSGDKQARQAGTGNWRGRLSQEGTPAVFAILLAAWAGRPGSCFFASQAGGPLGKVYYWSRARVEACQVPAVKGRQDRQSE